MHQELVGADFVTVAQLPLQFADPHSDPREFRGIGVNFNPQHTLGCHPLPLAIRCHSKSLRLFFDLAVEILSDGGGPNRENYQTHMRDREPECLQLFAKRVVERFVCARSL